MRRTITVEFSFGEDEFLPLTWAQSAVLDPIRRMGDRSGYYNLTGSAVFAEPIPFDEFHGRMVEMIAAIDVLRTRFEYDQESAMQRLCGAGVIEFDCVEVEPDQVEERAEAIADENESTHLPSGGWCHRGILLCTARGVAGIAMVFSHLAADAWARDLIMTTLSELGDGRQVTVHGLQPRDQIEHESSTSGAMFSKAALAHWRRNLRTAPDEVYGRPSLEEPSEGRWAMCRLLSTATSAAAVLTALRLQVSTSAVMLAASALLLDRCSEHDAHLFQLIVGNRFTERSRRVLTTMTQDGVVAIEVGALSFDDLVKQCFLSSLEGYQYGSYDYAGLCGLRQEELVRRGHEPDLEAYFNDVRSDGSWPELEVPASRAELYRLADSTETAVVERWDAHEVKFFASVFRLPAACDLSIIIDTAYITTEAMLSNMLAMEQVLMESAWAPVESSRIDTIFGD